MIQKVACVTGSRRGIGLGIAKALAAEHYTIVLSAVSPREEALSILEEFKSTGAEADYIPCNISSKEERKLLFQTICERYGRLDVLVNNAGVAPTARLDILETTEQSFDRLMQVNLKGTFFMCQMAANLMLHMQQESLEDYIPRIVNISSISAYTSSTSRGEYCISKSGISMTTQLFADRLAEFGIPVFEVRPGIILTDMTTPVQEKYEKMIADGITPIKRFGRPEDVANCVLAAVSGKLDFATGQILNADGGFHLRRL